MGEVTGPISSLPGKRHELPDGTMCDEHPDRPAVARVQGETDSFGSELIDMCAECLTADREYENSAEAHTGICDWCKNQATDLRNSRDYEEGLAGRVYQVCGACIARRKAELAAEDDDRFGGYDDFDDAEDEDDYLDEDCGMGADGQCSMAGSEFCDWDCPRDRQRGAK